MQSEDFDDFLNNLQAKVDIPQSVLQSFQVVLGQTKDLKLAGNPSCELNINNIIDACHKTKQKDLIDRSPAILGLITGKPLLEASEEDLSFIKMTLMDHIYNKASRLCAYNMFALCSALCNERSIKHNLPYNIHLPILVETVLKQKIKTCPVCEPNDTNVIYSGPRVSAMMGHFECMRKALKSELLKDHNKQLYNQLILFCAVKGGNLDSIKYLSQLMGCKMNLFTAYYTSIPHKNLDLIKFLGNSLEPSEKLDDEAKTMLIEACEKQDFQDGVEYFKKL